MRKKKVGILTYYYQTSNFGGVLQAYALPYYLRAEGIDCEQICYRYNSLKGGNRIQKLQNLCIGFLNGFRISDKIKKFHQFEETEIPHSIEIYDYKSIQKAETQYDCLICGSDQIWHPLYMDENFFLQFLREKNRKISYGCSFGTAQMNEKQWRKICGYLESFGALSVREESAAEKINETGRMHACSVVDPVLLLPEKHWISLAEKSSCRETGYVLVYFLNRTPGGLKSIQEFAERKRLDIVNISSYALIPGAIRRKDAGPEDFLYFILHADYIISDSFHCAVFSVIFRKQFVCTNRDKKTNSRMKDFLELCKLEHRYHTGKIDFKILESSETYENLDLLEEKKEFSKHYLYCALKGAGL